MESMFVIFSGTKEEWEKKLAEENKEAKNNINNGNQSGKEGGLSRF